MAKKSIDDFSLNQFSSIHDHDAIDRTWILDILEHQRPYNSERELEDIEFQEINEQLIARSRKLKSIFSKTSQCLETCLVENAYIKQIFPRIKITKPGFDFYSYIVFI